MLYGKNDDDKGCIVVTPGDFTFVLGNLSNFKVHSSKTLLWYVVGKIELPRARLLT